MLHYTGQKGFAVNNTPIFVERTMKHSSLFGKFERYEENECCEYGPWCCMHKILRMRLSEWNLKNEKCV